MSSLSTVEEPPGHRAAPHRAMIPALLVSADLVMAAAARTGVTGRRLQSSLGFLQTYIAENAGFFARAGGTFIGAIICGISCFRGQLGFSISFLEEMWARISAPDDEVR